MQTPIQKQKYKKDETHKGISNPKSPNPQIPIFIHILFVKLIKKNYNEV